MESTDKAKILVQIVQFTDWPELFSCSAQLSIKNFLLVNVKMPTIVGILTFMGGKNNIVGLSEPEKKLNVLIVLYF